MPIFDAVESMYVKGKSEQPELRLLALHTCGFCKRAKSWLEKNNLSYHLIYLDDLSEEQKKAVKEEFKKSFGKPLSYPTLIIGETDFLPGFIEIDWQQTLLPWVEPTP